MKACVIAPVDELHHLVGTTRVHLLLPYLCENDYYRSFYQHRSSAGEFLILDNGAYLTDGGKAWSMEDLLELSKKVGATEVVLPDVIGDAQGTSARGLSELRWLCSRDGRRAYLAADSPRLMIVPQGGTSFLWSMCLTLLLEGTAQALDNLAGRDSHKLTIGVSKVYGDYTTDILRNLSQLGIIESHQVHLLGWAGDYSTLKRNAELYPDLRSVDSARPVNYARELRDVRYRGNDHVSRVDDYFHKPLTEGQREVALGNINLFREAVGDSV